MASIEELAELLTQNISGWEQSVLKRIGERVKKIGGMTPADAVQLNNAADVTRDMDAIVRELAAATGQTIPEAWDMYEAALKEAQLANDPLYNYRGKVPVPIRDDKRALAMIRASAKNTGEMMLNLAQSKMLFTVNPAGRVFSLQSEYQNVLDKAVAAVSSGATDFHTAMRESIRTLGGNGIRVNYGSGISRRIDTVVRQNLMWGAKQVNEEYQEMIGEELGCDGIEVDWHGHPRPSHEFMNGRQFHIGGDAVINGKRYKDAAEALERLEDYNCYHYSTPIICGVSEPRYSDEELKKLDAQNKQEYTIRDKTLSGYEWSQNMRKLESEIRRQKSIKEMAKAAGDKTLVGQCDQRINACMGRYKEISEETGIPMDTKRLSLVRPDRNNPPKPPISTGLDLQSTNKRAIVQLQGDQGREMANGLRTPATHILSEKEIEFLKEDIRAIGADERKFVFNQGNRTGYSDELDLIFVRGDVLPSTDSKHPRDVLSSRAALAHEYYGHMAHRGTKLENGAWNDEFRASYTAARFAPNLSEEDRRYLVLDALERAREAGVSLQMNKFMRGIIYGY